MSYSYATTTPALQRSTKGSAAYDLPTLTDVVIKPGCIAKIDTGIKYNISSEYYFKIEERSSIGSTGVAVRGGILDSDYKGNIIVILHNLGNLEREYAAGKNVAQMILCKYCILDNEIDSTETRIGGFGSTDFSLDATKF